MKSSSYLVGNNTLLLVTSMLCFVKQQGIVAAFSLQQQPSSSHRLHEKNHHQQLEESCCRLHMQKQGDIIKSSTSNNNNNNKNPTRLDSDLYAFSIDATSSLSSSTVTVTEQQLQQQVDYKLLTVVDVDNTIIPEPSILEGFWFPVLSAASLVTGTTVGASMLVLPDVAAGPGMGITSGIMCAAYIFNLISGLAIAQVAIQQHDTSGSDVPSSFKEFSEATLPAAANIVSGISVFCNALILAFDTTKAGQVAATITGMDVQSATYVWAAIFVGMVTTLSLGNLSQLASLFVMGLFASFAGLLLPGLANVSDPLAVLTSSSPILLVDSSLGGGGGGDLMMENILHALPVILTTLVYQNVVPSVTRMLDYDRTKTMTAIVIGSFIPLLMYFAWCVVVLGGGVSTSGVGGSLMTVFSLVTVAGSNLGALISLSEEFQIFLGIEEKGERFALPSVALPAGIALLAGAFFASDINDALAVAGSFGSPILYGMIPVAMVWSQQQKIATSSSPSSTTTNASEQQQPPQPLSLVPGGMMGLSALGVGAIGLVGSELTENVVGHLM